MNYELKKSSFLLGEKVSRDILQIWRLLLRDGEDPHPFAIRDPPFPLLDIT